jgi:hypothetical protein
MLRLLMPCVAALGACAPPQETAMRTAGPPYTTALGSDAPGSGKRAAAAIRPAGVGEGDREPTGPDPAPAPTITAVPTPGPHADSPDAALGRRILSTAFVRVGPDGHLTVELRDGQVLVLRDVVMRREDYCGVDVLGAKPDAKLGARRCGGYAEVAVARPGGGPPAMTPEPADGTSIGPARLPR